MRNFKGLLVLALAVAMVIGVSTTAKAGFYPVYMDDLATWLTDEVGAAGFTTTTSYTGVTEWHVTALAYEANYLIDFYADSNVDPLFSNQGTVDYGVWKDIFDINTAYYYVNDTNKVFALDPSEAWIEVYQLLVDWDYDGQIYKAGTYIVGFDDGNQIDDNHDDFILAFQAVPIPGAVWLLGSGLVGLAGLRRKFRS